VTLPGAPIDEIRVDDWRNLNDINLTGSFIAAHAAFAIMRRQNPQGGRIINNGSVTAARGAKCSGQQAVNQVRYPISSLRLKRLAFHRFPEAL
jgi:NAD(P)-dependent dehydrogenase (short-subunit alcohol dehydrogenase family)